MLLGNPFVLDSPSFINLWHLFHNVDLSNDQKVHSVHVSHILVLVESSHPGKIVEFIYCHSVPSLWSYFFQEFFQAFTPCASSCRGAHTTYTAWQGSGERDTILSWDFVHLNCLLGENILWFLATQLWMWKLYETDYNLQEIEVWKIKEEEGRKQGRGRVGKGRERR